MSVHGLSTKEYLNFYQQQGNGLTKFHGSAQYGRGLGSFLAGMARAALPMLLKGGANVITNLAHGKGG